MYNWQVLKNIAETGKTVVCTIHQPSSEVFAMFDRILLMADGRTAFLGPASDALSFFALKGLSCPPNYNPADFYIHILATVPGQEEESKKKSREICDAYNSSEMGQQILAIAQANRSLNSTESQEFELGEVKVNRTPYKASWFAQLRAVFWRSVISVFREPVVLRVKIIQTIVSFAVKPSFFFKFILNKICKTVHFSSHRSNLPRAITSTCWRSQHSRCSLHIPHQHDFLKCLWSRQCKFKKKNCKLRNTGVIWFFVELSQAITGELPIFLREHFNGMYRTDVYFISKSLADLPLFIILPFIFISIPYFAIGLNPAADRFFIASGIIILVANVASAFGKNLKKIYDYSILDITVL